MIFTLEALEAKKGDSLILHYGQSRNPKLIVIDGGPDEVYSKCLSPRLTKIKKALSPGNQLPIEMLMVSHIDDDHIQGVLDLTDELIELRKDRNPLPYQIKTLWYNSFDDILGNKADEIFSRLEPSAREMAKGKQPPPDVPLTQESALLLASVAQGRRLRDNAKGLAIPGNRRVEGLIMSPESGVGTIDWGDGLSLTIVGPNRTQIDKLHSDWEKNVKNQLKKKKAKATVADYTDRSVYNLSSIVVMAEMKGKRILLTGDARGDHVLGGLETAGLMKNGTIHVDVLKMPHHGSSRNVKQDFFERIKADHYVISGNGEHDNPEISTLKMLSEARGKDEYILHLTNRDGANDLGPRLKEFFSSQKSLKRKYKVVFRDAPALSLKVDLLDPVKY